MFYPYIQLILFRGYVYIVAPTNIFAVNVLIPLINEINRIFLCNRMSK